MTSRLLMPVLIAGAIVASSNVFAQDTGADKEKILVGPITIEQLIDLPGWFGKDFVNYTPEDRYLDEIPQNMKGVKIVCVLGTWCDDSKREVPRLIRIFQLRAIDPDLLTMFGVDRNKVSPDGETAQYAIERVPTFIFLKDGKELGRIVETPISTLFEKDMLLILKGLPVTPPPPPPPPPAVIEPPPPDEHAPKETKTGSDGAVLPEKK
jgi:hypothetical protein